MWKETCEKADELFHSPKLIVRVTSLVLKRNSQNHVDTR